MQERAPSADDHRHDDDNRAASSSSSSSSLVVDDDDEEEDDGSTTNPRTGSDADMAAFTTTSGANPTSCTTSMMDVLYLSLFSIMGYALRIYVGRFFGGDCEYDATVGDGVGGRPEDEDQYHHRAAAMRDDFLWPLSRRICVTSSGMTIQHGGALFVDMPANMLGCSIMGYFVGYPRMKNDVDRADHSNRRTLLTTTHSSSRDGRPPPAMRSDGSMYLGIKTGLCGSLTTFSSWNTQMIIMMDGSANPYLGKQIFAALFGYLLGYQASLASYLVGRTLGAWRSRAASGGDEDPRDDIIYDATPRRSGDGEPKIRSRCHRNRNLPRWMAPMLLSVVVVVLIGLLVAGDAYWGIPYYRELWIGSILAPMGTLLRYRLSALNGGKLGIRGGIYWFPFGTFLANLLGSIISAAIAAWIIVTSTTNDGVGDARRSSWTIQVLNAISMGVAGCLSTVSTYAKECVELGEKYPPHDRKLFAYSHGTMLCCCLFGLIVYSPIVRFA